MAVDGTYQGHRKSRNGENHGELEGPVVNYSEQ